MAYRVTAGAVTVETAVVGTPGARARQDVRRGALLPDDVPAAEVQVLLDRGDIKPVDGEQESVVDDGLEVPAGTIEVVLAWVDGDPGRAAQALAVEQERGDKARSTLVDTLAGLVGPPQE